MKLSPDYRTATNAAYQILADTTPFSFSTNVFAIAEEMPNCRILTYGQASSLYGFPIELLTGESEYGFSIVHDEYRIILYNENIPISCIRFTIAHEIGHAVLGHYDEEDPAAEKEANCFARNFLCPIPVVDGLEICTVSDYVSIFNVSEHMARVARTQSSSDRYYINAYLEEIINDKLFAYMNGYENVAEFYMSIYA